MYGVSSPLSQGIGTPFVDSLPQKSTHAFWPSADTSSLRYGQGQVPQDNVRLSEKAWTVFGSSPIDTSVFDVPDNGGLLIAARVVHQFLEDHPRVAESGFGKSAALFVRAAVHLEKAGDFDALPEDSRTHLLRALNNAEQFLSEHPRVAESPFGRSVAELAKGLGQALGTDEGNIGTEFSDWLIEAAKKADLYLDEYPSLASMPLGEVVKQLTDGIKAMADGNPLDADLQTLAKRVGHFLQSHPRLAQSEFGQIIAPLGRGIAEIDVSTRAEVEPPAAGTIAPAAKTPLVLDMNSTIDMEAEARRAA